ncbi:MAG: peptide chain release factor N(5)-glutamine methyltransferase [Gallionella sp.]|jgi:release factor glutamine methyltransferase
MNSPIQDILRNDGKQLETALSIDPSSARIEVQCLLQEVLKVNRAYLLTHPERILSDDESARYTELFERRLKGEPIAYLLGMREFYGLEFKVTPATLIPRHDTELLVEIALQKMPSPPTPLPVPAGGIPAASGRKAARTGETGEGGCKARRGFKVLDMGTGSGAIALSIAHERPDATVVAVDASQAALQVARENCQRLKLSNIRLLHSDWFSQLSGERFDLIVSNPPYIEDNDPHLALGDVRFEPMSALASGADGLDDIRHIVSGAKNHLRSGGWLMFEHGYDQAARVREIMQQAGYIEVASLRDLAGIERVTIARA